jgi:hypothetical protein
MRHVRLLVVPGLILVTAVCGEDGNGGPPLPSDTVAPAVTALAPPPLAQDVARDATIRVTFSEPINPATVGIGSFLVRRALDTVPGSYVFDDSTIAFAPDAELASLALYSVTLTRGIRDPAGNQLIRDTAWSFRTRQLSITAPPR